MFNSPPAWVDECGYISKRRKCFNVQRFGSRYLTTYQTWYPIWYRHVSYFGYVVWCRCIGETYLHISFGTTVYPMKYAHGFVVLCFVVVMQSFIMNSHEAFIHIHQGCFAGTGAIVRLPQCQWSKPDGYGKISQCITTAKHSKAKTVCIFLGIYCISLTLAEPLKFGNG